MPRKQLEAAEGRPEQAASKLECMGRAGKEKSLDRVAVVRKRNKAAHSRRVRYARYPERMEARQAGKMDLEIREAMRAEAEVLEALVAEAVPSGHLKILTHSVVTEAPLPVGSRR